MIISLETLALFMLPVLALAFAPGPGMLYVAARTLAQGKVKGIVSVLGLETGTFLYVVLATLGLSAILTANPHWIRIIETIGAFYLIYLGLRAFFSSRTDVDGEVKTKISKKDTNRDVFVQGVITNILNPKVALFFIAFLPPFVDVSKNVSAQFFLLGLIFIIAGIVVNLGVVFLVDWFEQKFVSKIKSEKTNHYGAWILSAIFITMGVSMLILFTFKYIF